MFSSKVMLGTILVLFLISIGFSVPSFAQVEGSSSDQPGNTNADSSNTSISPTMSIPSPSEAHSKIPGWVKGIFDYYGQGQVTDEELISAIKFLIQQKVIEISYLSL